MNDIKISIIGDSHSRVFSNTNVFTPFFIGPGSKFNLIQNPDGIKEKVKSILENVGGKFNYNMIIFGEPACRYQIDNDHYIYKKDFKDYDVVNQKHLDFMITKYEDIIVSFKGLNLIVCAPISVYEQSIKFSMKFSDEIKRICEENTIHFIDVKDSFIKDGKVDDKYKADPIHASQEVLGFVEDKLKEISIDVSIKLNKNETFMEIKNNYKFNEKFNCYVY